MERELELTNNHMAKWLDLADHVSVRTFKIDVQRYQSTVQQKRVFWRYLPDEMENLQADASKCQRYTETWRDVLVPGLRKIAASFRTQMHLASPSEELTEHPMLQMCFKPMGTTT